MNKYILFVDGKEVSLENFLKENCLTEEMADILLTSGIPIKTIKGKKITHKLITN